MNRLTKKHIPLFKGDYIKYDLVEQENCLSECDYIEIVEPVIDKYGELEDIEEEIGVDLVIKDKVEQKRVAFVKTQDFGLIHSVTIDAYGRKGIHVVDYECVITYFYLPYKDYGVDWALTREELEK